MSDTEYKRTLPTSQLDYEMLVTDPAWGVGRIPKDLREKLEAAVANEDDEMLYENLWELHGYFTRDLRLGNLSVWDGEHARTYYDLESAGVFLRDGHIHSFISALADVAARIELSQSKKGFLRKSGRTQRHEIDERPASDNEQPKRSFLGGFGGNKE